MLGIIGVSLSLQRFLLSTGTFEESVLNGRLEPVSTVHGFSAELGASGAFVPKHMVLPVTVFFYNLGDRDKMSSPYLVSNGLFYPILITQCFQ